MSTEIDRKTTPFLAPDSSVRDGGVNAGQQDAGLEVQCKPLESAS